MSSIEEDARPRNPGPSLDDTWVVIEECDQPSGFLPAYQPPTEVMEYGLNYLGMGSRPCRSGRGRKNASTRSKR